MRLRVFHFPWKMRTSTDLYARQHSVLRTPHPADSTEPFSPFLLHLNLPLLIMVQWPLARYYIFPPILRDCETDRISTRFLAQTNRPKQLMDSFSNIDGGSYYTKGHCLFLEKSDLVAKDITFLKRHLPAQVSQTLSYLNPPQSSSYNVLSIGSGSGTMDIPVAQVIKEELQRNEKFSHMKIYNRAVEPNEHSLSVYRAAIDNLPYPLNDDQTVFDLNNKTFWWVREGQTRPNEIRHGALYPQSLLCEHGTGVGPLLWEGVAWEWSNSLLHGKQGFVSRNHEYLWFEFLWC